jgi:hypothetical protein
MKRLTSAQLFGAPKMTRKTKARLARAKLVVAAARDRAVETAQQRGAVDEALSYRVAEAPLG